MLRGHDNVCFNQASSSIIKHHQATLYNALRHCMTLYDTSWCFMMLHDASWHFMKFHDPCCNTLEVIINDLMMFWGFGHWLTHWLTHKQTTLVVKSLSGLKRKTLNISTKDRIPAIFLVLKNNMSWIFYWILEKLKENLLVGVKISSMSYGIIFAFYACNIFIFNTIY